ncbi:Uncharacterised protein [Shigella sonnei]|nr:Uncharacterised protein [Shigella sonnei]
MPGKAFVDHLDESLLPQPDLPPEVDDAMTPNLALPPVAQFWPALPGLPTVAATTLPAMP